MDIVNSSEKFIIESQLNRKIYNVMDISKRCCYGYPQVIKSYPLKAGVPFPTLYWLTCPYLIKVVSDMESEGKISELQNIISKDENLKSEFVEAHKSEIKERFRIAENEILKLPEVMIQKMKNTGIGGIKNFETVKCLHLHLASFLGGTKNPVGRIVWGKISSKECFDKQCIIFEQE
jgi:hypothetical protein